MNTINKLRILLFSVMTMIGVSIWGQGTRLSVVPNELSFGKNEETEERTATVIITNEDYENQSKYFTAEQLPEDIILAVSTSSIPFENVRGENNFTVTSNVDLELVAIDDGTDSAPSWFRLDKTQFQSPDANGNTESFKVTVDKNKSLKRRSGKISIRHNGNEMGIVSIEQEGSFASVAVSAASFNFEAESKGKSKTLVVTSNVGVIIGSVSSGSDWLAVSPSEITHDDATVSTEKSFTLSVISDNTSGKVREAKFNIIWTDENDKLQTKEIIVVQMAEGIIFTVNTSSISFENVGSENNFTVTSNVDLELVAVDDGTDSAPSWFRLDKTLFQSPDANGNTESFKVTVDKNRSLKGRSGKISIRHNDTEMGIVSIEQDGSFASVTVSAASFNFEAESKGKSKTLVVTSNVGVTIGSAFSGSDWLAASPSSITHDDATVSTEKSFTLSVISDNTSGKVREAKFNIIWTDENDKLQRKEIIVIQHSHYLYISVSALHYEPSGGSMTVNVTSDISWDVSCIGGGDWLSVTPFTGKNDGILTLTAKENANLTPREATIEVLSGSGLTQTIEIYQEGNGSLTVDCTKLENINLIYNLLGQKVEKSSIDRLPNGIYVINGAKVLISNK